MSNSVSPNPEPSHFISLEQAIAMTSLYRKEKEAILMPEFKDKGILPICETFDRAAFDYLLNESGCVKLRFYLGMDEGLNVRIIAVGVNDKNEDMLPLQQRSASANPGDEIVENGQRCPDVCPPSSPLN